MKKTIAILLCGMLLLTLPLHAFAASVFTTDRVPLAKGQTQAEITLTVEQDGAYAGAEFGLQCADGITVESVRFDQGTGSVTAPTEARGITWFSFFSGSNAFEGPVTATVTLSYAGESDSAVALQYVSIYQIRGGGVDETLLTPQKQILLDREGDETPVPPLEPPAGAKPNPPSDSAASSSGASQTTGGLGTAESQGGRQDGADASAPGQSSPSASGSDGASLATPDASDSSAFDAPSSTDSSKEGITQSASGGVNTGLLIGLLVSVAANAAFVCYIIQLKKSATKKER